MSYYYLHFETECHKTVNGEITKKYRIVTLPLNDQFRYPIT